jgi:hypothetical protein
MEVSDQIATIVLAYLGIFVLSMFFDKFRNSFFDWMAFKDPLGLRFWVSNWWFLVVTVFVGAAAAVLIVTGGE